MEPPARAPALWPGESLKGAHWLLLEAMRQSSNELAGEMEGWDGGR